MASHFSSIGLPVGSEEEFMQLLERIRQVGTQFPVGDSSYFLWESGVGSELWLQVDENGDLLGVQPHYSGSARMLVHLTNTVRRDNHSRLDGSWHAWAEPDGRGTGTYPFVFDAQDFLLHEPNLPQDTHVQLAAFAHEITAYTSEAEFDAASSKDEASFAVESFIPAGLFSPGGGSTVPPEAHAIFTGRILDTGMKINPLNNESFYWALVKTLGGLIDVVAAPDIVTASLLQGGVITGSFWLSGRLLTSSATSKGN